jgi:hypothetical protein
MSYGDETYRVEDAEIIRDTELAILFNIDGTEHWIPKSQITDMENQYEGVEMKNPLYDFDIPVWLAENLF